MTKLSEKTFKQQIALLAENFNFQLSPEYLKLIYMGIKDKTSDEIFSRKINAIILGMKASDWNKDFGFSGRPAIADCIELFCVKRQEIPCTPFLEFGTYRSSKLESYEQALKRELSLINNEKKLLTNRAVNSLY